MQVQVPWDVSNMFGDVLSEETDGADDEEVAAYEDSKKRLKVRFSRSRGCSEPAEKLLADLRSCLHASRRTGSGQPYEDDDQGAIPSLRRLRPSLLCLSQE